MPLSNLLTDFFDDVRAPGVLWQVAAIAASVLLGWTIARLLRNAYLDRRDGDGSVMRLGVESFARVLSPLLALGFIALAKLVLVHYQHVNLLRVAMPLAMSLVLVRLAYYLLRRVFMRNGSDGGWILTVGKIFAGLVWVGVALYITGLWDDVFSYLTTTTLPLGRNKVSLETILQAGVSVIVLLMAALWAGAALDERLMGLHSVNSSLRVVLARVSRALLVLVAVLVSLSMVGIDLTVLSVFGGALGVGLGLGLQKIASNYVSGFVILLERSLSIGDMIAVDKYAGKVTHINTRYTVLQGLDGVETVLPNEMLISGPVQNQSLSNRSVRIATTLTVSYDSDLDVVIPLLEGAAKEVVRVLAEPAPSVSLLRFSNDGYELELGGWIQDPENGKGGVLSDINKRIYALIQAGQVKLAYPSRDTKLIDAHINALLAQQSAPPA
jgi:small-conductance mechanosensitive channel